MYLKSMSWYVPTYMWLRGSHIWECGISSYIYLDIYVKTCPLASVNARNRSRSSNSDSSPPHAWYTFSASEKEKAHQTINAQVESSKKKSENKKAQKEDYLKQKKEEIIKG